MATTGKSFEYAVELDNGGRLTIPGGGQFVPPEGWSADHLLLAALVRCSIESFAYHARHSGHAVQGRGSASGQVTRRESDGRYAFVSIDCVIHISVSPPLDDVGELTAKAERDCFVGATLAISPRYEWRVE